MGWAEFNRMAAYETSAKTGYNIDLIFLKLAEGKAKFTLEL